MGIITNNDRKMILEKVRQNPTVSTPLETTFITGFKQLAHNLNTIITSHLPSLNPNQQSLILIAIDYYKMNLKILMRLKNYLVNIPIIHVKLS